MADNLQRPGEKAQVSGQYEITGPNGGGTEQERTVTKGELLPQHQNLVNSTSGIDENCLFTNHFCDTTNNQITSGSKEKNMKDDGLLDCNDLGGAARDSRTYRIQFALDNLNFRSIEITDPIPLGRQILATAGVEARGDYSLLAILPSGDFEDIRLDEVFDLRRRGVEQFLAFHTDREFKLTLDDRQLAWGKPAISGSALYKLANVGNDQAVFLEVRGGEDKLIVPEEMIDLTAPGIERFITAPPPTLEIDIIVNARPRVVTGSEVTYEQIVQLAFPGSHNPNSVFSITYRKAASTPPNGELGAGGVVKIKKGAIFNVTQTDKS